MTEMSTATSRVSSARAASAARRTGLYEGRRHAGFTEAEAGLAVRAWGRERAAAVRAAVTNSAAGVASVAGSGPGAGQAFGQVFGEASG
ncbi:hypothetical protein [Nonomuraea sp. NPDC005692]|uniref:hypothetical protein n=1 Tax=Nonomuraea sp. NPDC005692 TaxID=3157168 RepID=UPI0033CC186A